MWGVSRPGLGVGVESQARLITGWAGWLMRSEAGCQCEPVIEGGRELPPWIPYILTAALYIQAVHAQPE